MQLLASGFRLLVDLSTRNKDLALSTPRTVEFTCRMSPVQGHDLKVNAQNDILAIV